MAWSATISIRTHLNRLWKSDMSVRLLHQCLNCGRYMMLEKWYPEMPCDDCKREIDPVLTDKNEGLEHTDERY